MAATLPLPVHLNAILKRLAYHPTKSRTVASNPRIRPKSHSTMARAGRPQRCSLS